MPRPYTSKLRIRVINTQPTPIGFVDDLGLPGPSSTLWHSLGTEAGTDLSINYWTQGGGVFTYAASLITVPATIGSYIYAGNRNWQDVVFTSRVRWNTGASIRPFVHGDGTNNNFIFAAISGTSIRLFKMVAGVFTQIGVSAPVLALVNATFYWTKVTAVGTTYTVAIYADSAGAIGTLIASVTGVVPDAGLQQGYIGFSNPSAAGFAIGGAFNNVCTVVGSMADGWSPIVVAGEPAFAQNYDVSGNPTSSIELFNAAGSGRMSQAIIADSVPSTFSITAMAAAGTANGLGGGLTTPNATGVLSALSITGTPAANPTILLTYSGAVGIASYTLVSLLPTGPGTGVELTTDLPTLNSSSWHVVAMQPGNPASVAGGSFTINLHPPGSKGWAENRQLYGSMRKYLRIEAYESQDGSALGDLFQAGVITEIEKAHGRTNSFIIRGQLDPWLAAYSRPFPGELLATDITNKIVKSYLGNNEIGWTDAFNPFVPANYVATATPSGTTGVWTGNTDEQFPVVSITGTAVSAVLLSKQGAQANDRWQSQFVEVTGRLRASASTTNAGYVGVGLCASPQGLGGSFILAYLRATTFAGRKYWTAGLWVLKGGKQTHIHEMQNFSANIDDPTSSYCPFTLGLLLEVAGNSTGEAVVTLNGSVALRYASGFKPRNVTMYPFLYYSQPTTGTAQGFFTNFAQLTRFSNDGPSTASRFIPGATFSTSANTLHPGTDPGSSFLDVWSRAATRDGWYWRYTPIPYVIGTRTLGTVDYGAEVGTDLGTTKQMVFSTADNTLLDLALTENADPFMTGTAAVASATPDGGGIGYWRDIASMALYGVIEDHTIAPASDMHSLRKNAYHVVANKIATDSLNGAKTATIMRTAENAGRWRELDKIMVHDPELGVMNQVSRVLAYTYDEGVPIQVLTLDQFGAEFTGEPLQLSHPHTPKPPPHKGKAKPPPHIGRI